MSKPVALITGAGGEVGTTLIPALKERGYDVVTVDLVELPREARAETLDSVQASVLDDQVMDGLIERYRPTRLFHLAAILSAKAEREPGLAHDVNVGGTFTLFRACLAHAADHDAPIRFLFPSSIAIYGLPDAATKVDSGAIAEPSWNVPTGMYGCNKLYCELVGTYLSRREHSGKPSPIDFRAVRFPGLISADTLPTSGSTDYAPGMIHAAAKGEPYSCFVREDTALPFMTMPDAVTALLQLAEADAASLSTRVYNIRGFGATAGRIRGEVREHFPAADITFDAEAERQALVDSWPADIDDTRARQDWGFAPRHDLPAALTDYLLPALKRRYAKDPA